MRKLLYYTMVIAMITLLAYPFLPSTDVTYQQISEAIPAYVAEPLKAQNINACKKNFQLSQLSHDDFIYYLNEDAMDVDEIIVIRCERNQQDAILNKFQERIDTQKQKFDGYGVIQMEKLNQAQIKAFEDGCILIISNDTNLLTLGGLL